MIVYFNYARALVSQQLFEINFFFDFPPEVSLLVRIICLKQKQLIPIFFHVSVTHKESYFSYVNGFFYSEISLVLFKIL
jgi:hypothetical protein